MAAKDLYNYLGRQQPMQVFNKNLNNTTNGALQQATKTKQMVKQHSTASQQSTSSTSSVHSAPDQLGKQQSPSRQSTTSLERQLMNQYHQQHYTAAAGIQTTAATITTFSSMDKDRLLTNSATALQTLGQLKTEDHHSSGGSLKDANKTNESYHSDTQLHVSGGGGDTHTDNLPASASTTLKKRKKGLRFGFGSKKSHSNSNVSGQEATKTTKSK